MASWPLKPTGKSAGHPGGCRMSSEEAKLPPWEAERPRQQHGHPLTLRQEHLGPDTP